MELDFDRLSELGVVLLPCPFEDGSYTVVDREGKRRGRLKQEGNTWVAIFQKEIKGKHEKIEEASKLLL